MDGLKDDLKGQADVLEIDLTSAVGRETARDFGVKVVPTILVFDGNGTIVLRQTGLPDAGAIREQVAALAADQ